MSRLRSAWLAGAAILYATRAATLALNAVTAPRLRPAARTPESGRVSILVPARGEAETLPRLLPALAAQGADELLLYDDGDNGTAAIELARDLGFRVLSGDEPPPGWIGKSWACHQLAEAATGELLVFTDADTRWRQGSLAAIVAEQVRSGSDLLSVLPRAEDLPPGARVLTPLVENVVLTQIPFPLLATGHPLLASASGALIAITREAYQSCGGHAALRGQLVEDVQLARSVKRSGGRARLMIGDSMLGVRMYGSYRESVEGFSKNLVAVHQGSRVATVLSLAAFTTTHLVPWLIQGSPGVRALRAASLADRALVNLVSGRRRPADLAEGLLGPVTPLFALPALLAAFHPRVVWKGRSYDRRSSSGRSDLVRERGSGEMLRFGAFG